MEDHGQYRLKDYIFGNNFYLYTRYDRNHIAKVSKYKSIFENCRFKRGYFIEDTWGQSMISNLKSSSCQEQLFLRHEDYGTWLYTHDDQTIYIRHLVNLFL